MNVLFLTLKHMKKLLGLVKEKSSLKNLKLFVLMD